METDDSLRCSQSPPHPSTRPSATRPNFFYTVECLVPAKLGDHLLSRARDCLLNIFAATFHIWWPSSSSATKNTPCLNTVRKSQVVFRITARSSPMSLVVQLLLLLYIYHPCCIIIPKSSMPVSKSERNRFYRIIS